MKRLVTVTFEVDPGEYVGVEDTDHGAINLTLSMLEGDADFPDRVKVRAITCEESS